MFRRKYRSDFYKFYFKFADIVGKRHYIEEQYRENIPSGSYLRWKFSNQNLF